MRIMAIDYGDAHTGIAISDPTGFMAGTTTTIHSRKAEVVLEELDKLVKQYQVEELVMGFPKNMDGTEGPRADGQGDVSDLDHIITYLDLVYHSPIGFSTFVFPVGLVIFHI